MKNYDLPKIKKRVLQTHRLKNLESVLTTLGFESNWLGWKKKVKQIRPLATLTQMVDFKVIKLKISSPTAVLVWTTRSFGSFVTADYSPLISTTTCVHNTVNRHPEVGVLPTATAGNTYKTATSLWNGKGSITLLKWIWLRTALKRMSKDIAKHHVMNAQTIDYKTLEPYKEGLFCNTIFSKQVSEGFDYQRRTQMGYIKLVIPCAHIWHLKSRPKQFQILLNMKPGLIKLAAYYKAMGARQPEIPQMRWLTKPMQTLFQNRNKNLHYCHTKTFWLNHTFSFNALPNCLFNNFILNWGYTSFLGLSDPKKNYPKNWKLIPGPFAREFEKQLGIINLTLIRKNSAWEEQSTDETLGGLSTQDASFWSKAWGTFLSPYAVWGKQNPKWAKTTWQQEIVLKTNQQLNKSVALFQAKPNYFDLKKQLVTFVVSGIVFNTLQSVLKINNTKSAVILTSCPGKLDQFSQTEVHSNYSPALKAFFNHVWAVGHTKQSRYKADSNNWILSGYKSNWVPKIKPGLNSNAYKKQMVFSTYKQGLNDFNLSNLIEPNMDYFKYLRLLIYSQLVHWEGKQTELVKRESFLSQKIGKNRLSNGFRWLAATTNEFQHLSLAGKPNTQPLGKDEKKKIEKIDFQPVSLYTRLLEITKKGQVQKIFLLPFLDHFTHLEIFSIEKQWLGLFSCLRLSGAFHTQTQTKPNPLGTFKYREFLQKFFQLSWKKNNLICLIKKSKEILLSSILEWDEFNVSKKPIYENLNQLDYEKQKCVYHFLNQLLFHEFKKPKPKKRVIGFVSKQHHMLKMVENSLFSGSEKLFHHLTNPFCHRLLNKTFQRRNSLNLLNPFLLKENHFLVRYLQPFRGPSYQNFSNFILGNYNFKTQPDSKKNKIQATKKKTKFKEKRKMFGWHLVSKRRNQIQPVQYPFPFEPPASYLYQLLDLETRIDWLRSYFSYRKDLRRNTFSMVPTRFILRKSFKIIEEEWLRFENYVTCDSVDHNDLCLPSYIDRILFIGNLIGGSVPDLTENRPMYNAGGEILRHRLRLYSNVSQVLTFSLPEIENNKRRRAVQEPCIFSYDHEPFFHERNIPTDPIRVGKPIYYQIQSESPGVFINWILNEIDYANQKIHFFEEKLHSFFGLRLKFHPWNQTKSEISVVARRKENQPPWVDPGEPKSVSIIPFFSKTVSNTSKRFYHRKMYASFVALRKQRFHNIRRFKTLAPFFRKPLIFPEWMMIQNLPVLPPDLRPILFIGDQVIISDLTKIYQQIIYRNDRCISRYERYKKQECLETDYYDFYCARLLQESIDALMENGKGDGKPLVSNSTDQPLKSFSDILKGKKGRFRQNLLGKRADYSGRSVIVVGPKLDISECGLPKEMALELFKPFLMRELLKAGFVRQAFSAKKKIDSKWPYIWDLLRKVMAERPVLLNRAPTLHRLGIQAFRPKLVSGRAILLHPLVCSAYNADFDGDQMAVHVPLTSEACSEAWKLMWSRNNLLSPATGDPSMLPSQDMILGCYYLTTLDQMHRADQLKKISTSGQLIHGPFQSIDQLFPLVQTQVLDYHSVIWLKWPDGFEFEQKKQRCIEMQIDQSGHIVKIYKDYKVYDHLQSSCPIYFIKTTPGRALINQSILESLK